MKLYHFPSPHPQKITFTLHELVLSYQPSTDHFLNTRNFLDLMPIGRQEENEEMLTNFVTGTAIRADDKTLAIAPRTDLRFSAAVDVIGAEGCVQRGPVQEAFFEQKVG
jgi:hypothetical protein